MVHKKHERKRWKRYCKWWHEKTCCFFFTLSPCYSLGEIYVLHMFHSYSKCKYMIKSSFTTRWLKNWWKKNPNSISPFSCCFHDLSISSMKSHHFMKCQYKNNINNIHFIHKSCRFGFVSQTWWILFTKININTEIDCTSTWKKKQLHFKFMKTNTTDSHHEDEQCKWKHRIRY